MTSKKQAKGSGVEVKNHEQLDSCVPLLPENQITFRKFDTYPTRRVRFYKRQDVETHYIQFSMNKNGIFRKFTLYDGEVYDLPEDVISYLQGIVREEQFTKANSNEVEVKRYQYYSFEFLD